MFDGGAEWLTVLQAKPRPRSRGRPIQPAPTVRKVVCKWTGEQYQAE